MKWISENHKENIPYILVYGAQTTAKTTFISRLTNQVSFLMDATKIATKVRTLITTIYDVNQKEDILIDFKYKDINKKGLSVSKIDLHF